MSVAPGPTEDEHALLHRLARLIALTGLLLIALGVTPVLAAGDVVVLVETPSSGDRLRTARDFIDGLTTRLPDGARVSMVVFRDQARVVAPLGSLAEDPGAPLSNRLGQTNADDDSGIDTAGALERAIYELRMAGGGAPKLIVLMGNGAIDTGDPARDAALNAWLRDDLATQSREAGIRIFWLTTSESADYRLVQTVTRNTGGNYYRAFDDTALATALDGILGALHTPAPAAAGPAPAAPPPATEPGRTWPALSLPMAAGAAGVLVLLAVTILRVRGLGTAAVRSKRQARRKRVGSRVEMRDVSGFTGQAVYDITGKRTFIGRQPREVTRSNFVIVIPDQAISRNHATIEFKDNGYWIQDSESVNGTFVNGDRLSGSHLLRNGDRIRFAKFEFEFILPSSPHGEFHDDAGDAEPTPGPHTTTETSDDDRTLIRPRAR